MSITPRRELEKYLKQVRRLRINMRESAAGRHPEIIYAGVEDFVLMNGTWFTPATLPLNVPSRLPGTCYDSAYKLARRFPKKYHYVEGYALSVIPMLHGWCIDKDGNVVDPTWDPVGTAYCGVELDLCEVRKSRKHGVHTLLDDMNRGYPALRGMHVFHREPFFPTDNWPKPEGHK